MTIETILYRFRVRGGTAAALAALNEVPLARELVYETDTGRAKLGDGATTWNDLPYLGEDDDTTLEFRVEDEVLQYSLDEADWIDILDLSDLGGSSAPRVQIATSTPGGTFACDWSLYDDIRVTLTEATVTVTFSGAVDGQVCRLKLAQDSSGGRVCAMPPEIRYNDTFAVYSPDKLVNHADLLQFRFDDAESSYDLFSLVRNINTAGAGAISEITTGITWTQSSTFSGLAANATNMRDANSSPSAGAATGGATNNAVVPEWIRADLGSARPVSRITVGGGNLPSWGGIAVYLNGATIQYSLTGSSGWTTVATISGVTDTGTLDKDFDFPAVVAQYWRIARSGYLASATFKLYG